LLVVAGYAELAESFPVRAEGYAERPESHPARAEAADFSHRRTRKKR
jgi:hypothetical protein